jgi:hypothetical protein
VKRDYPLISIPYQSLNPRTEDFLKQKQLTKLRSSLLDRYKKNDSNYSGKLGAANPLSSVQIWVPLFNFSIVPKKIQLHKLFGIVDFVLLLVRGLLQS